MYWIALRMLMGDTTKYLGLIFGVTFATHLMSQQVSIFMGIMSRTGNAILDVKDAAVWVMDSKVRFVDEAPPLPSTDLFRVRGVPGVDWAVRMYKGQIRTRLDDGGVRNVYLTGIDDDTLVGVPQTLLLGNLRDLQQPDAVIIDSSGFEWMWPKEPLSLGKTFQINDRRAVVVGICKAGAPFFSVPMVYCRYNQAARYVPQERNLMNYILVQPKAGQDPQQLAQNISEQTKLMALTRNDFFWKTIGYFLSSTGIPVNFGVTIVLGFIVGAAVTGQTLYLFTTENLKQFGALKAMGTSNSKIVGMILMQALLVGVMGYGLGVGMTALFFIGTGNITHLAGLSMTWVAYAGTGVVVLIIIILSSLLSARKVLVLEPAIVFRG
jgi:putative ABC transport system permease protein